MKNSKRITSASFYLNTRIMHNQHKVPNKMVTMIETSSLYLAVSIGDKRVLCLTSRTKANVVDAIHSQLYLHLNQLYKSKLESLTITQSNSSLIVQVALATVVAVAEAWKTATITYSQQRSNLNQPIPSWVTTSLAKPNQVKECKVLKGTPRLTLQ